MYVLTCCMASALKRLPDSDHSSMIRAKQHLSAAVALSETYHKTWNSIYWNTSRAALKRRIREKLHHLAFETYTELTIACECLNEYIAEVGSDALPPNWHRDVWVSIYLAITGMEENNATQIWQRQLSLF